MSALAALPWCENCQAEVEAETNESNGFTCVPRSPPSQSPTPNPRDGHNSPSRSSRRSIPRPRLTPPSPDLIPSPDEQMLHAMR